jgi:hypothetical protein
MAVDKSKSDQYKQGLYAEVAKKAGVNENDVKKVMEVLGIHKHFDEATRLIGSSPSLDHLLIGFRVSPSSVTV